MKFEIIESWLSTDNKGVITQLLEPKMYFKMASFFQLFHFYVRGTGAHEDMGTRPHKDL